MDSKRLEKDFIELLSKDNSWIKKLNGKTILVTGATGLIGSVLCKALLYYNANFGGKINLLCGIRNNEKAARVFGDFSEARFASLDVLKEVDIPEKIDYIVHTANTTSSLEYVNKPVETIDTIVTGTKNLLELARKKQVEKFVYLSSMETYGSPDARKEWIEETDSGYINTMSVRSSYSEGKRLAECMCASYASEYKVNAVVARLAQVFGAGVSAEDNRVFMQLCRSAINKTDFVMRSDGSSSGNYCYTTDALKAILMLLTDGKPGEAYNVVNEQNATTIREMAEMVANDIASGAFKVVYDIPDSDLKYGYAPKVTMKLSSKKINALGWQATVPLKEMYERTIEYIKE